MVVQVLFDGSNQRRHVLEGATTQPLVGYFAEPALHQVEPGTGGRDKVKMEPRVTAEPGFHARSFGGAVIIHDQMQVQPGRGVDVNPTSNVGDYASCVIAGLAADSVTIGRRVHVLTGFITSEEMRSVWEISWCLGSGVDPL